MQTLEITIGNTKLAALSDFSETPGPGTDIYDATKAQKLHYHAAFEVFFACGSTLKLFTMDGSSEYENSVVIIPPRLYHYAEKKGDIYGFTFKIASKNNRNDPLFDFLYDDDKKIRKYEMSENIKNTVCALRKALFFDMYSDQYKITPLMTLLFLNIADVAVRKKSPAPKLSLGNERSYTEIIDNIISKEYMNKITLGYVADRLFLSERQTARIIKKAYNQSFSELLLSRRLTVASVMLTTTGEKVSGIAESTGFRTENYFFSCFRKRFGMTPICYRKLYG